MRNALAVVILICVLLILPRAEGQTVSECELLARQGVMTRTVSEQSTYERLLLLALLTRMDDKEGAKVLSHVGKVGFEGLSIGPGSWDSTKREQLKSKLEQHIDIDRVIRSSSSIVTASGDAKVIEGINNCFRLHGGLSLIFGGAKGAIVEVDLTWTPFPGQPTSDPEIIDVTIPQGVVIGGKTFVTPGERYGIRFSRAVTVQRDPTKDFNIIVNTKEGSASGYLPAEVKWLDQMVCRIDFGFDRHELVSTGPDLVKDDCVAAARNAGASDVKLGCQAADRTLRFGERFCVGDQTCLDHIPPADGRFGPQPNCGWR